MRGNRRFLGLSGLLAVSLHVCRIFFCCIITLRIVTYSRSLTRNQKFSLLFEYSFTLSDTWGLESPSALYRRSIVCIILKKLVTAYVPAHEDEQTAGSLVWLRCRRR